MRINTTVPAPPRVAFTFERRQPCDARLAGDDAGGVPRPLIDGRPRGESVRPAR